MAKKKKQGKGSGGRRAKSEKKTGKPQAQAADQSQAPQAPKKAGDGPMSPRIVPQSWR